MLTKLWVHNFFFHSDFIFLEFLQFTGVLIVGVNWMNQFFFEHSGLGSLSICTPRQTWGKDFSGSVLCIFLLFVTTCSVA